MNEGNAVSLIALVGWLILVGGAFASYKLNWKTSLKQALTWIAIFWAVFVLFTLVRGQ